MKKYGNMGVNKYQEMWDSRLTKGLRVLQREGFLPFIYRSTKYFNRVLQRAVSPLVISLPRNYFSFKKKKLPYFRHKKSVTWINERAIEIPIVVDYLRQNRGKKVLEVGAVLYHYYPQIPKDVLDKFEKNIGIINEDAISFNPTEKYDHIISISTLEHVGFDDDVKDPDGILKSIKNLKENCLKEGGEMLITLPIGYNKDVDGHLFSNRINFVEEYYYQRKNFLNIWKEISKGEAKKASYVKEFAETIVIGFIR